MKRTNCSLLHLRSKVRVLIETWEFFGEKKHYRAFLRFGQAKCAYGRLIFGLSKFSTTGKYELNDHL